MGIEDDMDDVSEMANTLGIKGDEPTEDDEPEEESAETVEASETAEMETSPTAQDQSSGAQTAEERSASVGGVEESGYPNPDKEHGSLQDLYENINVYVPPDVKEETHTLFKELEYRYRAEHGDELDKHWDFYTALFRTILQNDELLREELDLTDTSQ